LAADETDELVEMVEPLVADSQGHRYVARAATVDALGALIIDRLTQFHAGSPERPGMAEDSLPLAIATRLTRAQMKAVLAMLATRGEILSQGGLVRLASHSSSLGAADQRLWERIEAAIGADNRFRPPQVRELSETTGQPITTVRKLLKTMARLGSVVEVASDRFFLRSALLELGRIAGALAESKDEKAFTAAEFRDR